MFEMENLIYDINEKIFEANKAIGTDKFLDTYNLVIKKKNILAKKIIDYFLDDFPDVSLSAVNAIISDYVFPKSSYELINHKLLLNTIDHLYYMTKQKKED